MSKVVVRRPIWRKFLPKFSTRAAEWVREGGHAAIEEPSARGGTKRIDLLLGVGADGKITELGQWSLLAIEQERYVRVKRGAGRGLATAKVKPEFEEAVLDWCERDAAHAGPTRTLRLDCLECGSCCHDSNVVVYDDDLDRFRAGGRADLISPDNLKRKRGGPMVLRWPDKGGPCRHLRRDLKCRIYELRPFNCRVFPVGSEACLAARELTRSWRDG
jgi:Fe-S-cluster containining protein